MVLGILGAMEKEVETLRDRMAGVVIHERGGMTFWQGTLEGLPVVLSRCGIGKVNAALGVQVLADCFGVTAVVNTGVAGSLDVALDIGDLVISRDVMYHDVDCHDLDYPVGQVPGMDVLAFPADEALSALALEAAESVQPGHVRLGRVASGDQFVCSRSQKEQIVSVTGGLCTEMEGAAIAQAAWRNRIPFVIIRAISDKADDSAHMDYPTFASQAAARCARIVELLAGKLAEKE